MPQKKHGIPVNLLNKQVGPPVKLSYCLKGKTEATRRIYTTSAKKRSFNAGVFPSAGLMVIFTTIDRRLWTNLRGLRPVNLAEHPCGNKPEPEIDKRRYAKRHGGY